MTYIDGFVIAVPTDNRQKFIDHAGLGDPVFLEHGAKRVLECWQADVPKGKITDFFGAVAAREDESIVFSWIEWPDRKARQAMYDRMEELARTDERLSPEKNPMPFDGMRMIFGGFEPVLEEGRPDEGAYVQGFIVPVPEGNKEAYRKAAKGMWDIMKDYGAMRIVEAWQDDVSRGEQTDFFRAVKAEPGEIVVFSFVEWSSREDCDSSHEKMMQDERMKSFMEENPDIEPPFDGRRMVYGGFQPVVELTREKAGA
jgi:uncharacterized protein YbaA (DUF1428 family)